MLARHTYLLNCRLMVTRYFTYTWVQEWDKFSKPSPMQWTWTWANSRRWWGTGRPGVLQSVGSWRIRHNLTTEQHFPLTLGTVRHYHCFLLTQSIACHCCYTDSKVVCIKLIQHQLFLGNLAPATCPFNIPRWQNCAFKSSWSVCLSQYTSTLLGFWGLMLSW